MAAEGSSRLVSPPPGTGVSSPQPSPNRLGGGSGRRQRLRANRQCQPTCRYGPAPTWPTSAWGSMQGWVDFGGQPPPRQGRNHFRPSTKRQFHFFDPKIDQKCGSGRSLGKTVSKVCKKKWCQVPQLSRLKPSLENWGGGRTPPPLAVKEGEVGTPPRPANLP